MKTLVILMGLLATGYACAEESTLKDGVKSAVTSLIATGKDVLSGTKDGVDEGRKSGESLDGAVVINDSEALQKHLSVRALSVEQTGNQQYQITLALRNDTDNIIRLANLQERKSLQLLDKDGFVAYLQKPHPEVTVPQKAAIRERFVFIGQEDTPVTLRLYGMDIALPSPDVSNKPQ